MAQNQLVEAAQAMRKMKQHVEQLARTKRDYESTINDMAEKLSAAEKANLDTRSQKIAEGVDQTVVNELDEARAEVNFLRSTLFCTFHLGSSSSQKHAPESCRLCTAQREAAEHGAQLPACPHPARSWGCAELVCKTQCTCARSGTMHRCLES